MNNLNIDESHKVIRPISKRRKPNSDFQIVNTRIKKKIKRKKLSSIFTRIYENCGVFVKYLARKFFSLGKKRWRQTKLTNYYNKL